MLKDSLVVFQISIVQTLSITQLETIHKRGYNWMIYNSWLIFNY